MNSDSSSKKTLQYRAFGFVVVALLMVLSVPVCAQRTITLPQAIKNALQQRKQIQAGKSNEVIRRLQTEALYRKYWPQINLAYSYMYNPILQTSILPIGVFNPAYPADATKSIQFGTKWSQAAGLTVNQPLIDVAINRQLNEAKLQQRVAAAAQAQTEYQLGFDVAAVYIDIALQDAKVRSATADTIRTRISYQLLLNRYEQQRLLKSELNKARINHNNALQQYRNAVSKLIEDKVYLLFLTGETGVDQTDFLVDTVFVNHTAWSFSDVRPATLNIPELQQLQLNGDFAALQTKTEKAKYLPTVSMKGFVGANQYTNNFDPIAANTWFGLSYVGIDLKYPLLSGEHKHNRVLQLEMQSGQYYQQKEDRAAEYDKDALLAKLNMIRVQSEMETQMENRALSIESIAIFQDRVAEGQESAVSLNLEEASLQVLDAAYQSNRMQYWLYLLDYLKATGNLELLWKH
jgi:outer membrane protein TolC